MIGSNFQTTATIKRLTQTADKSAYAAVSGVTLYGLFLPLDPAHQPAEVKIGQQAYKFSCDGSVTVNVSDFLVISSVDYAVKGIRRFTMGSLDFLDIIVEKSVRI